MAMTFAALKTEIQTDPAGVGYASAVASGADGAVADLINTVRAGAAYSIFKSSVPIAALVANIDSTNFAALTALQLAKLQLLFAGSASLDATDLNTRNIVTGVFTGMAATLANLTILVKRQGSRAEVLWGDGTRITADDVAHALRG